MVSAVGTERALPGSGWSAGRAVQTQQSHQRESQPGLLLSPSPTLHPLAACSRPGTAPAGGRALHVHSLGATGAVGGPGSCLCSPGPEPRHCERSGHRLSVCCRVEPFLARERLPLQSQTLSPALEPPQDQAPGARDHPMAWSPWDHPGERVLGCRPGKPFSALLTRLVCTCHASCRPVRQAVTAPPQDPVGQEPAPPTAWFSSPVGFTTTHPT